MPLHLVKRGEEVQVELGVEKFNRRMIIAAITHNNNEVWMSLDF